MSRMRSRAFAGIRGKRSVSGPRFHSRRRRRVSEGVRLERSGRDFAEEGAAAAAAAAEDINLFRVLRDGDVLRAHGGAWIEDARPGCGCDRGCDRGCDGDAGSGWLRVRSARARRGRVVVGIAGVMLRGEAMRCGICEAMGWDLWSWVM